MAGYTDYMMYNNNSGVPGNLYDQQLSRYQQQLSQYQQGNPYANYNNIQQPQIRQQVVQQPIQPIQSMQQTTGMPEIQARNDLYLQSLFMEFLRSPEMSNFTTEFYSRFSQFYKHKTGLDFNDGYNMQIPTHNNAQVPMTNVQPQMNNTQVPINNVQVPMNNIQSQVPMNNIQSQLQVNNTQVPINNVQVPMNNIQPQANNVQIPMNNNIQPQMNNVQVPMQPQMHNVQPQVSNVQPQMANIQAPVNNTQMPVNNIAPSTNVPIAPPQEVNTSPKYIIE